MTVFVLISNSYPFRTNDRISNCFQHVWHRWKSESGQKRISSGKVLYPQPSLFVFIFSTFSSFHSPSLQLPLLIDIFLVTVPSIYFYHHDLLNFNLMKPGKTICKVLKFVVILMKYTYIKGTYCEQENSPFSSLYVIWHLTCCFEYPHLAIFPLDIYLHSFSLFSYISKPLQLHHCSGFFLSRISCTHLFFTLLNVLLSFILLYMF